MSIGFLITSIIVALLFSALFSGSEIAFISASKLGIELQKKKGSRRGMILAKFYDRPAQFLGAMLVGNNIALVVYSILMNWWLEPYFLNFIENTYLILLLNTVLTTLVVLLFGEFLPKTIFRVFSNRMLYAMAFPLAFFRWILGIPTLLMTSLSNFLLKYVVRTHIETDKEVFTRTDLQSFVAGQVHHNDENMETDMFTNILNMENMRVRECMVPRTEIEYIDILSSLENLKMQFIQTRHSRLIVIDDDIDNVIGYVHHQQLLQDVSSLREIILDIPIIPEVLNVTELMTYFKKQDTKIACVVDEFGGTSGIITMEDILEEIFGEIVDEYDDDDFTEEKISDSEFLFSGRIEIDYLNEKYAEIDFPDGDFHTLSGYIIMTTGDIPEEGSVIELGSYRFVLEHVSDTKIEMVRVIKILDENETS